MKPRLIGFFMHFGIQYITGKYRIILVKLVFYV